MLFSGECFSLSSLPALFSMLKGTNVCWEAFVSKDQLVSSLTSWRHLHTGVAAQVLPGHQCAEVGIGHFAKGSESSWFQF